MKKYLMFLFFGALGQYMFSQVQTDWIRGADVYSKSGMYLASDILGNAYVASFDGTIWLKKYDQSGNMLWELNSSFAGFNGESPSQIHIDPSGNPVIVAYQFTSSSDGHFISSIIVLKYNASGEFVYKKYFDGTYSYFNNSQYWTRITSQMDSAGNLYIGTGGQVKGYPYNGFNVIKVNPSGGLEWVATKTFKNNNFSYVHNIRLSGDRIGVVGTTTYAYANATVWVIDTAGNDLWNIISPGIQGRDISFDNNRNAYVLTFISTETYGDLSIFKFDENGNQLWNKLYDFGGSEQPYMMIPDHHGHLTIMASGNTAPDNSWYTDWLTLKVDLDGNVVWSQRYDEHSGDDEVPRMMVVDKLSNVYITGIAGPFPGGSNIGKRQMVTVKYDDAGNLLWKAIIDTLTEYNTGVGIAMDAHNGLYVLGSAWSLLLHYIDQTSSLNDEIGSTVKIFPNPAISKISVAGIKGGLNIEIIDISGQIVYTGIAADIPFEITISQWCNGIYFLRVRNEQSAIKFVKAN